MVLKNVTWYVLDKGDASVDRWNVSGVTDIFETEEGEVHFYLEDFVVDDCLNCTIHGKNRKEEERNENDKNVCVFYVAGLVFIVDSMEAENLGPAKCRSIEDIRVNPCGIGYGFACNLGECLSPFSGTLAKFEGMTCKSKFK